MNEFTSAPCVICGKTTSIMTYQYRNGVRTICIDCQRRLEDEKQEALSTD